MRDHTHPVIRAVLWTVMTAVTLTAVGFAEGAQTGAATPRPPSGAAAQPSRPAGHGAATTAAARPAAGQEAELRARVLAYWQRRQAKDLAGMYEFYCADYQKKVSRDAFLGQTRLTRFPLMDAHVSRTAIDGTRAVVSVTYTFLQPTISPAPLEQTVEETWIRERNQWRKLDEPLVLPFPTGLNPPPGPPEPGDEPPAPSNAPGQGAAPAR